VTFWQKDIGKKRERKMLMKLTQVVKVFVMEITSHAPFLLMPFFFLSIYKLFRNKNAAFSLLYQFMLILPF